ncbi:fungal-specific transcription factor domain-containing protein [Hypoxylon trugodes]|uniref:fungal-specific transcription factor domain-containing protein n=1 Tax=Hypoxylon trugodes TaxID=326681 RepID=UPI0021A20113|nr:fungal-specific transcription factor domain-containing protein [Hypoxylon trugodes]KAI1393433.1 fungal-specific transcription factor domain-containing protein [Hypoxylon trugodes]
MYTPTSLENGSQDPLESPTKRRHVEGSPRNTRTTLESGQTTTHIPSLASWDQPTDRSAICLIETGSPESSQKKLVGITRNFHGSNDRDFDSRSRVSNASGAADEAEIMSLPRMLMDTTGKLLYVGESASLSYLQLIRMIVETISGPSEFTTDPQRHNLLENTIQLPSGTRTTGQLPDRKTADVLIDAFFTNTSGLVDVFNKKEFLRSVEQCYSDPLNIDEAVLCIFNLVFAIGLVVARPLGAEHDTIIRKLRSEPINRAELFFRAAKKSFDSMAGFEDGNFWSIQALLLMSLYLLAVSQRNASYVYHGMAVRFAFALGLHREESMVIFEEPDRQSRKNVWRTLFILDRFLAACLGRPITISEEDCSENALQFPPGTRDDGAAINNGVQLTNSAALDAAVRSCFLIGLTLKKVYSKRKVSTLVAQEIAERIENWEKELHQNLDWRRIVHGSIESTQAIAILHVNLLHCHSVVLLTRPFFLYLLKMGCDGISRNSQKPPRCSSRLERFSQACVEASQRTIIIARAALDAEYLPQCNPFVIYFVFAAALVILSNEFALLYHNPDGDASIQSALHILEYCGSFDAQARRVSFIVDSFHRANQGRDPSTKKISLPGRKAPTISTISQSFHHDPTSSFSNQVKAERRDSYMSDLPSPVKGRQLVNLPVGPSEATMRSMMPPAIQQPSPEGSVSLNNGVAPVSMAPGMEAIGGEETSIEFDTLWQGWQPAGAGLGIGVPPLGTQEAYGPYEMHASHLPQPNGLNPHMPHFPPADYR